MKIGIFNGGYLPNFQAGGATTFQESVLSTLAHKKSNHSFYFFSDDATGYAQLKNISVIPWHHFFPSKDDSLLKKTYLKGLRLIDRTWCMRQYKSFLQRSVIEHSIDMVWFLVPVYRYVDVPYVFTVWDLQHRLQPYFPEVSVTGSTYEERERVYSSVIPRAAYIVVGNEAGKKEIELFYGVPSWRIKVNPMPTPPFALEKVALEGIELPVKKPYLFYPAQFWPHKNHVVILRALKILKEKHNSILNVVFTGSDKGNACYIKELVGELGLQDHVQFMGFVDQNTLIHLYQHAFCLVFTSFFGPDNIPPLEAFGLGCPVIAARVSGAEHQLEGASLLFDPTSEYELVEKILLLQQNSLLRDDLIAKGRVRAAQFSSELYVDRMLNLFDEFESIRRCWSKSDRYKHT